MFSAGWGFSHREFFDLGEETRADLSVTPEVKF
jgi:LemA protein